MERRATTTAVILVSLALAGCNAAQNAAAGAGAYMEKTAEKIGQKTEKAAEKIGQTTDDASITVAVKGELLRADERLGKLVKVSTGNGIVSLAGAVPTAEDKARAEEI